VRRVSKGGERQGKYSNSSRRCSVVAAVRDSPSALKRVDSSRGACPRPAVIGMPRPVGRRAEYESLTLLSTSPGAPVSRRHPATRRAYVPYPPTALGSPSPACGGRPSPGSPLSSPHHLSGPVVIKPTPSPTERKGKGETAIESPRGPHSSHVSVPASISEKIVYTPLPTPRRLPRGAAAVAASPPRVAHPTPPTYR